MFAELDEADAAASGFALGVRSGWIVQKLGVKHAGVRPRGTAAHRVEEQRLELLLIHVHGHVAHLQARLGDEKVGVLELHRLLLLGAATLHDVALRHPLRRGALLVHLSLVREVEVTVIPRSVATGAPGALLLGLLLRQARRLARAHREGDRESTTGNLDAAALLLRRRLHRARRGGRIVEIDERGPLGATGRLVDHQSARSNLAELLHALVQRLLGRLDGQVTDEHRRALLGGIRTPRAGERRRDIVVPIFRLGFRLGLARLGQLGEARRLGRLARLLAAAHLLSRIRRDGGVQLRVRVLHHAHHHATSHVIRVLILRGHGRGRGRVLLLGLGLLLGLFGLGLFLGLFLGFVGFVIRTLLLLPALLLAILLLVILLLVILLVLALLLLRLLRRFLLRLGVGVLGERPIDRHRSPGDGGSVHLRDGAFRVRLGRERGEGEPLGLMVKVPRHGQIPHEPSFGARGPYVLVRRLEREVSDDDAPRLGLGALASAQLSRPQELRGGLRPLRPVLSRLGLGHRRDAPFRELRAHALRLSFPHAGHGAMQLGHRRRRRRGVAVHHEGHPPGGAVVAELRGADDVVGRGGDDLLDVSARARGVEGGVGVDAVGFAGEAETRERDGAGGSGILEGGVRGRGSAGAAAAGAAGPAGVGARAGRAGGVAMAGVGGGAGFRGVAVAVVAVVVEGAFAAAAAGRVGGCLLAGSRAAGGGLLLRDVDGHRSTVHLEGLAPRDSRRGVLRERELHEAEPLAPPAAALVGDDEALLHGTDLAERSLQARVVARVRQIAHEHGGGTTHRGVGFESVGARGGRCAARALTTTPRVCPLVRGGRNRRCSSFWRPRVSSSLAAISAISGPGEIDRHRRVNLRVRVGL